MEKASRASICSARPLVATTAVARAVHQGGPWTCSTPRTSPTTSSTIAQAARRGADRPGHRRLGGTARVRTGRPARRPRAPLPAPRLSLRGDPRGPDGSQPARVCPSRRRLRRGRGPHLAGADRHRGPVRQLPAGGRGPAGRRRAVAAPQLVGEPGRGVRDLGGGGGEQPGRPHLPGARAAPGGGPGAAPLRRHRPFVPQHRSRGAGRGRLHRRGVRSRPAGGVAGSATGWTPFDETLSGRPSIAQGVDPDEPALVGWTSGTTAGPKGVAHSSRSFISSPLRSARSSGYAWDDRSYMPAPLAHATGLLSAVAVPSYTGSSVVLRDHWDAELALDDLARYGVTFSSGASVFISELLAALAARGQERLDLPTGYPCGGSTIPTTLAEAADDVGMQPTRSWGMTECPSVSGTSRFDPRAVRCATDGRISSGCEVRGAGRGGGGPGPGPDRGARRPRSPAGAPGTSGGGPHKGVLRRGGLVPHRRPPAFVDDDWACCR